MSDAKLYGAVAQAAVLDPHTKASLFGAVAQVAVLDTHTQASLFGAVAQVAVLDTVTNASLFGAVAQVAVQDPASIDKASLFGAVAQVAVLDTVINASLFGAVAQLAVLQPTAVASVGNISGRPGIATTFNGSLSQNHHYYKWTWTSLPGGSALFNYPQPLPDNAVGSLMADNEGLYHFEGSADDSSGNARNGTVTGATQVTGKVGSNAYSFDGTNDLIDFGSEFQFDTGDFTFAFWIKPEATQNQWAFVFGTHGSYSGYALQQRDNNLNRYRFQTSNGSSYSANNTDFSLPADEWSHVVITRSGTVTKGYVNGIHVYTDVAKGTIQNVLNFYIGKPPEPSWSNFWKGDIDEFAVWSRVLSASEITEVYEEGSKVGLDISTATASFTPDVEGTYTVQLEVADGVTDTASAFVSLTSNNTFALQGRNIQNVINRLVTGSYIQGVPLKNK